MARETDDLGQPGAGTGGVVHEYLGGHPLQSGDSSVLPAPAGRREAKKVSLTACMRKLLTILNAMVKHQTKWQEVRSITGFHLRQLLRPAERRSSAS